LYCSVHWVQRSESNSLCHFHYHRIYLVRLARIHVSNVHCAHPSKLPILLCTLWSYSKHERPLHTIVIDTTLVSEFCIQERLGERDCIHYIIVLTYDVGLHSGMHATYITDSNARNRDFPTQKKKERVPRRAIICVLWIGTYVYVLCVCDTVSACAYVYC